MTKTAKLLIVSLLCAEDDLKAYCRRLVTFTNNSSMYLARVVATGTQVYPESATSITGLTAVLTCEFRMRKSGSDVDEHAARDVLSRIVTLDVDGAYLATDDREALTTLVRRQVAA
jgi:hypothetical protein